MSSHSQSKPSFTGRANTVIATELSDSISNISSDDYLVSTIRHDNIFKSFCEPLDNQMTFFKLPEDNDQKLTSPIFNSKYDNIEYSEKNELECYRGSIFSPPQMSVCSAQDERQQDSITFEETISNESSQSNKIILHPAIPDLGFPVDGILHAICFCSTVPWTSKLLMIHDILERDKACASLPMKIFLIKDRKSPLSTPKLNKKASEATRFEALPYRYAINLTIVNRSLNCDRDDSNRKLKVNLIEMLLEADPNVVLQNDGPLQYPIYTLHLMMKFMPFAVELLDAILINHPECAKMVDGRGNTPMHICVMYATYEKTCVEAFKHLYLIYPKALFIANRDGQTPAQLAQRRSDCPHGIEEHIAKLISRIR